MPDAWVRMAPAGGREGQPHVAAERRADGGVRAGLPRPTAQLLAAQTLNQEVAMTLPLSSNLYAGCIAGPAVCAGIFVVERLWGDKLDKTTTITYQVSGPWQDPQVKETEDFLE